MCLYAPNLLLVVCCFSRIVVVVSSTMKNLMPFVEVLAVCFCGYLSMDKVCQFQFICFSVSNSLFCSFRGLNILLHNQTKFSKKYYFKSLQINQSMDHECYRTIYTLSHQYVIYFCYSFLGYSNQWIFISQGLRLKRLCFIIIL